MHVPGWWTGSFNPGGAVMTAVLQSEGGDVYGTLCDCRNFIQNSPPTLYIMALYQGYIQVVSAVG